MGRSATGDVLRNLIMLPSRPPIGSPSLGVSSGATPVAEMAEATSADSGVPVSTQRWNTSTLSPSSPVAGHGTGAETLQNRRGVVGDVAVRPEIEGPVHG